MKNSSSLAGAPCGHYPAFVPCLLAALSSASGQIKVLSKSAGSN